MARLSESRRLTLITRAAFNARPIQITYGCEKDGESETRLIEIHDIRTTRDGNIILRAWCRLRGEMRTFRVDRITAHRTRRLAWTGPTPAVTPFFTVFGRVSETDVTTPLAKVHTASALLSDARARITAVRLGLAA